MEGFVVYINFGRLFKLSVYYFYWEKKVYDVLIKLIMSNLRRFEVALRISKFLFQVEIFLVVFDVVFYFQVNEVYKLIFQSVRDCVEG